MLDEALISGTVGHPSHYLFEKLSEYLHGGAKINNNSARTTDLASIQTGNF
jgi:hypothetical protein